MWTSKQLIPSVCVALWCAPAFAEPETDTETELVTVNDDADGDADSDKLARGVARVVRVVAARKVAIEAADGDRFDVGDRIGFFARVGGEPLGYGVIKKAATDTSDAICEIEVHERNQMIVAGDRVRRIDARGRVENWPGRVDLVIADDKHVSSRYKRPAYYGPFVGEGHPVEANELLIDPLFKLEYGITSRLSISTMPIMNALKIPNLGFKVGIFDNDFVIATIGLKAMRAVDYGRNLVQPSLLVSFPTNTKMMSHIEVSVALDVLSSPTMPTTTEPATDAMTEEQLKNSWYTPQLRSFSEYVFDNWDRVVGGPSYDFDLRAVGGFLSYMMVFDHFHMSFGVHTRNFMDFRVNLEKAYFPTFAFFWRI